MSDNESLEQRVNELEKTIEKMLPNRRQFAKGAATAAGAGILGFGAGNASADASMTDEDGNIGTPSDRVDIFADGIDANSLAQSSLTVEDIAITNDGDGSGIDADQIDGYDVEKDGTDGTGTINFKTS